MKTAYVVEEGVTVRRDGERLEIFAGRERKAVLPTYELNQLVVVGNVTLTPPAIDLLVDKGADVVLLSVHGRFRARIGGGLSSHVRLRMAQVMMLAEADAQRTLAAAIVSGKIDNQRAVLLRHARRHVWTDEMRRAEVSLRAARRRLSMVTDVDEVRGSEGAAASAYFGALGGLIRTPGFTFSRRSRRPPLDPVNAMLSFGYTLLLTAVNGAVHVVGLDPYLGSLHEPAPGRPSLACDLIEELRAPTVDQLVLAIVNKGAMSPDDFITGDEGSGVTMKREALRWFIELFERKLARPTPYGGRNLPWREVILAQARAMARHFLGEETYSPHRVR